MTGPSPDNANDEQPALADGPPRDLVRGEPRPATIGRLAALARRRTAKAGEVLMAEGGRSDEFGVVVSGRLALRMLVPERGMVTILTVEPGDLYGWSAIAAPQRATSTVVVDRAERAHRVRRDGPPAGPGRGRPPRGRALPPGPRGGQPPAERDPPPAARPVHPAERRSMVSAPAPTIDPTEPIGFLPRAGARPAASRRSAADGRRVIGPTIADGAVVYDEIAHAGRPARRLAGRPGARPLPARAARRATPVRLRDRPDRLEAVHLPAPRPGRGRPARRRRGHVHGRRAPDDAARVPGRPRLRAGGPRDPGHGPHGRPGRRCRLRRAAVRGAHRRGRVRDRRVDLLLHLDGHRSRGPLRVRPRPDRARRRVHRPGRVGRPGPISRPACRSPRSSPSAGPRRRPPSRRRAARSATRSTPTACRRACSPTSTTRTGPRSPSAASPAPTAPSSARPASARASASGPTSTARNRSPSGPGTAASPPASPGSPAATSGRATQDRYRQWLTHKFATWWDQFGSSGCVGCGRCVTWCPVGIDVRAELYAIAGSRSGARAAAVAIPPAPAHAGRPPVAAADAAATRRPSRRPVVPAVRPARPPCIAGSPRRDRNRPTRRRSS